MDHEIDVTTQPVAAATSRSDLRTVIIDVIAEEEELDRNIDAVKKAA